MWKGNPALASVLFGLPFGFFALICYSICCADIMDAEEDDDEEEQTLAAASRDATGMWNKIFSTVKIWNVIRMIQEIRLLKNNLTKNIKQKSDI